MSVGFSPCLRQAGLRFSASVSVALFQTFIDGFESDVTNVTNMPKIIVVGGHTRNIGKTQLVEEILRAFPERKWLAAKITQFGHGICSRNGEACGCADDEHLVAVDAETERGTGTDTSRFLDAGAARVLWVRTKQGRLAEAMPQLREEMAKAEHVILESNAVLGFLKPSLYLPVLDFAVDDFKDSARAMLDRADAYVVLESDTQSPNWDSVSLKWLKERPVFRVGHERMCSGELMRFIVAKLWEGAGPVGAATEAEEAEEAKERAEDAAGAS